MRTTENLSLRLDPEVVRLARRTAEERRQNLREFFEEVDKQPERGVIAHKLVFSLSQNERDELGIDMRQLVRARMDDWSRRLGRPMKWIGFEHMDAGHPHVHVVVAGFAGEKPVGVYERDLIALRESTEREKARQAELERLMPIGVQQPGKEQELDRVTREIGTLGIVSLDREANRLKDRSRGEGACRDR